MRDGQLVEGADLFQFLVVNGDPNASRLLWDGHQRARIRGGRVLDQACREVLVQGGANFIGQDRVDPMRPESDRRATFRERNLERHQGAGPKSVDFEKSSAKTQRTSPSCSIANEVQSGP